MPSKEQDNPVVVLVNCPGKEKSVGNNNEYTEQLFGVRPVFINIDFPKWLCDPSDTDFWEIIKQNPQLSLSEAEKWVKADEFTAFVHDYLSDQFTHSAESDVNRESVRLVKVGSYFSDTDFGHVEDEIEDEQKPQLFETLRSLFPNAVAYDDYDTPVNDYTHTDVAELVISLRPYNCLRRGGITTIGQLVDKNEAYLKSIPNLGAKALREIKEALSDIGLQLQQD